MDNSELEVVSGILKGFKTTGLVAVEVETKIIRFIIQYRRVFKAVCKKEILVYL